MIKALWHWLFTFIKFESGNCLLHEVVVLLFDGLNLLFNLLLGIVLFPHKLLQIMYHPIGLKYMFCFRANFIHLLNKFLLFTATLPFIEGASQISIVNLEQYLAGVWYGILPRFNNLSVAFKPDPKVSFVCLFVGHCELFEGFLLTVFIYLCLWNGEVLDSSECNNFVLVSEYFLKVADGRRQRNSNFPLFEYSLPYWGLNSELMIILHRFPIVSDSLSGLCSHMPLHHCSLLCLDFDSFLCLLRLHFNRTYHILALVPCNPDILKPMLSIYSLNIWGVLLLDLVDFVLENSWNFLQFVYWQSPGNFNTSSSYLPRTVNF